MPCDSTLHCNDVYMSTLSDISNVFRSYNFSAIIVGGNFNVDFNRTIGKIEASAMESFCDEWGLQLCDDFNKGDKFFTCKTSAGIGVSVIDHFAVSLPLYDSIVQYFSEDQGDNLSDHNPLMLHLK